MEPASKPVESDLALPDLTKLDEAELKILLDVFKQSLNAGDFPRFQREVLKLKTPRHYSEWWTLAQAKRRLLIEAHRDSWKSFFWSRSYPLFRAISKPGTNICLVSYSESQARKNLYWIKQMLETCPDLKQYVPKSNTFTWQKTFLHLTNNSTIECKGFGSAMRGGHFAVIVCDDILKDGTSMPQDDQQNFFFGVVTPACRKDGQIVVVGTPMEFNDLLETLEKGTIYDFHKYPVTVDGKVWFDEEYTMENVERWKAEAPTYYYFAREYLLQRINPDKAPFRESMISWYYTKELDKSQYLFKVMTIDPSLNQGGDAHGVVITGTDDKNVTYILDAVKLQGDLSAVVNRLFELYQKWHPDRVGAEMYGFQKLLKFWLEDEMSKRNVFFHIIQLEQGRKMAKSARILQIQPKLEVQKLKFRKTEDIEIVGQLLSYDPTRTRNDDDLIDALAYQVTLWQMPEKDGPVGAPEGSFDHAVEKSEEQAVGNVHYIKELFSDMTADEENESLYL